jgi:hypothetical protein
MLGVIKDLLLEQNTELATQTVFEWRCFRGVGHVCMMDEIAAIVRELNSNCCAGTPFMPG